MASDNFNRANGSLTAGPWTSAMGDFNIVSNQVEGGTGGQNLVFHNAVVFANDHWSEITVVNGGFAAGPAVRVSAGSGGNGYVLGCTTTTFSLNKWVAGVETVLQDFGSIANGDVVKLLVEGTTLRVYKNSVQQGSDFSDASLASGSAGIYTFGTGSFQDDWSGEDVAAAVGGAIVFNRMIG